MLNKWLFTTILTVGILLASIMPVSATAGTTVYNNLPGSGATNAGRYDFNYANSQSNSFTSALSFSLDSVTLYLGRNESASGSGGSLTVNLLNDSGTNTPGSFVSVLGTLSESLLTTTLTTYNFSGFAPVSLAGGTRYWINVVTSAGASSVASWAYATDATGIGTLNEYNSNTGDPGTYANTDVAPYQMQITVPEPDTLALMSLGLVGIGFGKRRQAS